MAKIAVRGMEMLFLTTMVAALAMFDSTVAQTTYHVGDSLGWLLPPGGDADYVSWASTKIFTVGDILVFNFVTGTHSVAEVSKEDFSTCNTGSTISISTTGPTSITLSSAGEHFYLCTFPGHCDLGQKVAINVSTSSSSSPAPQPKAGAATPSLFPIPKQTPAAPLSPFPSLVEMPTLTPAFGGTRVHNVGDGTWSVPQTDPSEYQTWTSGKSFKVGDVLEFNFANETHNVAEVSKSAFDSCDVSSPLFAISTSPARTTLRTPGEHYYICTFNSHCSLGQKLAINVTLGGSAPSSSASDTTPPSSIAVPPSNSESPTSAPVNSAPSSVAALPITLSIAFAYLY